MEILRGKIGIVREAMPKDIPWIADHMRESDVIELRDGIMKTPGEALLLSCRLSIMSLTVTIVDEPAAMLGIGSLRSDSRFGVIWFLATERMEREGRRDLRVFAPWFVNTLGQGFAAIGNLVDPRNTMSIKWLNRLGFVQRKVVINPITGVPFALMVKDMGNV